MATTRRRSRASEPTTPAPATRSERPKNSERAKNSERPKKKARPKRAPDAFDTKIASKKTSELTVRRMHRRDINRVWEFLKLSFRDVNRETVEYQRPRSKERFEETYDDEGVEQLVFEVGDEVVGYAECAYEVTGSANWINPRYFEQRDMRPLFV